VYHVIGVLVSAQQGGAKSAVTQVNADVGVQWLFSFLSADKKKTYCLYEAPNAEAIRDAAWRLNIPADVIIEVDSEVRPETFLR
jgi:Nickel responsive protein SCO4226-like